MKLFKSIIILLTIFGRLYLIFKVGQGLYFNHVNPDYSLDHLQWYIYALFLDFYIVKMFDNSNSEDIYSKKEDE
jgi:hypothetical protein